MLPYTYEDTTTEPRALALHNTLECVCNHKYTTTENTEDTRDYYV